MSTGNHVNPNPAGKIEEKVKWATGASYLVSLVLVAVANGVQNHEGSLLLGALPEWLESLILPLLPALGTFAAGYAAKHTHRPDLRTPPELPL